MGEYLVDGEYRRFEPHTDEDGIVWSRSEVMGINLRWDGRHFATQDPVTGYTMLGLVEANATILRMERDFDAERNARLQERAAREAAEEREAQERDARLQERDARLQERAAREAAEAQISELRAQLERQSKQ